MPSAVRDASSTPRLSAFRGLWPFLWPYRGRIALAFALLCLGSATLLAVPLAFRDLVDAGFGPGVPARPGLLGGVSVNGHFLALFGLAGFWALAVSARYYTVSWIGERVTADLKSTVYARVLAQSPQFFETLQTGEVLSRLTGDTTLIQTVVGSSVSMGLRSFFQFIGGKVKRLSRESQDRIADASALAGEILNAMPTVQAYTQEGYEAARFAGAAD